MLLGRRETKQSAFKDDTQHYIDLVDCDLLKAELIKTKICVSVLLQHKQLLDKIETLLKNSSVTCLMLDLNTRLVLDSKNQLKIERV